MRIVTAGMLLLVGCVTDVGHDGLEVGVSEQRLESGLYTRINSKLFSDGDGPASPLSSNPRASNNSDWLRCWVMAFGPDAEWACNDVNCRCIDGICPEESYWPFMGYEDGIWFVESNHQEPRENFFPYRTRTGANWPTYSFRQEADANWQPCAACGVFTQSSICTVEDNGSTAGMHVGDWFDQRSQ